MAFQPGLRTLIELPVADRVSGDTRIRQRARFLSLVHGQSSDGACTAVITVLVSLYAAQGEDYGEALSGPGLSTYTVSLSADNQTLVDAGTGQILAIRQGEQPADWQARIDELSQERTTMLQGDFFEYLRDNGLPGTMRQMIEQHIQQADEMGRFA